MNDDDLDLGVSMKPGDGHDVLFVDHCIVADATASMSDTEDGPSEDMDLLTLTIVYVKYDDTGEIIPGNNVATLALSTHAEADLKLGLARQMLDGLLGDEGKGGPQMRADTAETN